MKKLIGALLVFFVVSPSFVLAQSPGSEIHKAALNQAASLDQDVVDIAMTLWRFSEIALEEHQSSAYLAEYMEEKGFRVERGVAGMPTAFVAEWGSGRPIIGITAEFDALPNIGNEPVPMRKARADGNPHGHGCGHNLFGAGSAGAAVALRKTMQDHDLGGTIRLYGSPAEETLVGKVYMANAGLFDDLDAALDWHPIDKNGVGNESGLAMNNFAVEFFGRPAHGAYDPWNGRSALDAVELMSAAVNMMREHIEPSARIHNVITSGGDAPNVVPAYARVWYYVRDIDRKRVEKNYAWIKDIAAAAAMATQTRHEISLVTGVHEMLLNRPLQEVMQGHLDAVGAPEYTDDDQAFARELQTYLELEPLGLDLKVSPLMPEPEPATGGSTDVAEISWKVPTVSLFVASAGAKLPWHSWASAASHGRPGAAKSAQVAARVLALTGVDLLTRPELINAAKAFHAEQTGGEPYRSPIPVDQKPPLPESG